VCLVMGCISGKIGVIEVGCSEKLLWEVQRRGEGRRARGGMLIVRVE